MHRRRFLRASAQAAGLVVLGAIGFRKFIDVRQGQETAATEGAVSPSSYSPTQNNLFIGYADGAFEALMNNWYQSGSGSWRDLGWWNTANALETMINYSYKRPLDNIDAIVWDVYDNMKTKQQGNFIDGFYDDEGWWALALVKAYDRLHDSEFLNAAETIFEDILTGWDEAICPGGIWWDKKHTAKNAIENELFITLGTHLYTRTNNDDYLWWSERDLSWFDQIGLQGPDGLINDGVNLEECANNRAPTWTYNQGVILGGLSDMYAITGERNYLQRAEEIATAAMNLLVDDGGVLVELCESLPQGCGVDGTQFKGIFTRYLSYTYEVVFEATQSSQSLETMSEDASFLSSCKSFFARQARSIWTNNRDGSNNLLGVHWAGPFTGANASTQSSALDALIAAIP